MLRTMVVIVVMNAGLGAIPPSVWSQVFVDATRIGGSGFDEAFKIVAHGDGDLIVGGSFTGTVDFFGTPVTAVGSDSTGSRDFFVAKVDTNQNLQWIRHNGGVGGGVNFVFDVAVDSSGNVLATGGYAGAVASFGGSALPAGGADDEMFVAKYDQNGNVVWVRVATGSFGVEGLAVGADSDGDVFVTGRFAHPTFGGDVTFDSTTLTTRGGTDFFLVKYDPNGNLLWVQHGGGPGTGEISRGLAVDALGNVSIAGRFESSATFGVATPVTSAGSADIFLAKYDPSGNLLWVTRGGGAGFDEVGELAGGPASELVISGLFEGTAVFDTEMVTSFGSLDVVIAKYDATGTLDWVRHAGGSGADIGLGLTVTGAGDVLVVGPFQSTALFGSTTLTTVGDPDTFLTSLDDAGTFQWALSAGGPQDVSGSGVTAHSSSAAFVVGRFQDSADFGSTALVSAGNFDSFVAEVGGLTRLVEIDIKPGSSPNSLNPRSKGVVPVALLGSPSFDASTIDVDSIVFGPGEAPAAHGGHLEDVDEDGVLDLVLHFAVPSTGISCGDTEAVLAGRAFDGEFVEGTDSVRTVGCS